ncbi:MAG: DUF4113 domain-containing protein, partial [Ignavibacteriales bacterium]
FVPRRPIVKDRALMKAVDKTNIKWGSSTIRYGSSGLEQRWRMKRATLSPRYTTHWDEILAVE